MHSELIKTHKTILTYKKIRLKKPYLFKKLESNTLRSILNSNHNTAYQLALITNNIKEIQYFAKIESEDYWLTAYVKTESAFVGEAREQVWNVTHLQPLLNKKPRFTLKCVLTSKISNVEIYKCILTSIKADIIYNQIQECLHELNETILI